MQYRVSVNSGFAARRMAEQGCGVAVLPDFLVDRSLDGGRLVRLLPDWQSPSFGISAFWPPNSASHHLRDLLLKFLAGIAKSPTAEDTKIPA